MIPVKISNGSKTLEINALLKSGSHATLITSKLAHQIQLKGEMKGLNAISNSVTVKSKLFTFSISSRLHPEHLQLHNAWVVDTLNLPHEKVSKQEIQRRWPHLSKIPLDIVNKDVSIPIGADMTQPHINMMLFWENPASLFRH